MSLFKSFTTAGLEETEDRVGGFSSVEAGLYTATIKMAYHSVAASGANAINFVFDLGGREYRETTYITNKKGENFFLNKEDKTKKVPLPGFTVVDDICLCTTEKPLSEQDAQEKVVKIYDFDAKKELPKSVPVLVDLLGQKVGLGIIKTLENKNVKNTTTGEYEPTAETREVNSIDKVFHVPSNLTMVEVRNEVEEAVFFTGWVERNKGEIRDKRLIKDGVGGTPGRPGAPGARPAPTAPQAGEAPARKSLFGKK